MANLTRFWVAFIAGTQNYNFPKFLFYAGAASLTWNSLLVTVGYLAGTEREQIESGLAKLGILAWILLVIALVVIYWANKKEFKLSKGE
jgi:membrane protein DedA with SNARE-associated domain